MEEKLAKELAKELAKQLAVQNEATCSKCSSSTAVESQLEMLVGICGHNLWGLLSLWFSS